ncbi:MAG: glycosyltransferase family 87 protein [Nocardioidaceae bacterium]
MANSGPADAADEVVAPMSVDRVASAASAPMGGPLGRHAVPGRSWWTPVRVVLLVAVVCFGLGVLQKSPCVVTDPDDAAAPLPYSHMCYSDIGHLYAGRGLAEGIWPYTPQSDLPANKQPSDVDEANGLTVEYPVLTGLWMGVTGAITHVVGDAPDLSQVPLSKVGQQSGVQHDEAVFWSVNAVGFFVVLVVALVLLVRSQRRRPWDAMFVAASPALALTAFINWDMLAIGCVAGIIWAWSTRRPVLTGVFIGLGVATKLYPLFFLGPLFILCLRERKLETWTKVCAAALVAWLAVDLPVYLWSPDAFLYFWQYNSGRGPDFGSVWLVAQNLWHLSASPHLINVTTWIFFGSACALIGLLGFFAPRRPRLVQLLFLVVAAFLLVNKVYSPQYVLWLLPLAALARPRWRDIIIWQACEIFYFFAVWMHIANFFVSAGSPDWEYALAVVVRIAGEVYLMVLVVRDIFWPWHDPVRVDGLTDDPLGGVLDEGVDATSRRRERSLAVS